MARSLKYHVGLTPDERSTIQSALKHKDFASQILDERKKELSSRKEKNDRHCL